jgi:ABC-type antimicrobial peptide transport system permease subunit
VAQHARELAIRSALGAGRAAVLRLVLRRALVLAVTGCAAGLLVAAGAAQAIRASITGIQSPDFVLLAAVPALLILTALAAAAIPARRALRADPLEVLRAEN